jgi:hypothetical protein
MAATGRHARALLLALAMSVQGFAGSPATVSNLNRKSASQFSSAPGAGRQLGDLIESLRGRP